MKRAFIEIDEIDERALETLAKIFEIPDNDWKFDYAISQAGYKGEEAWEAIVNSDEIYVDTALIPSYMSVTSGAVFNNMMYKTIEANLTGKKVFIFRKYDSIQWSELRSELVAKAFKENELFVMKEIEETHIREGRSILDITMGWQKVDIDALIKDESLY